MRVMKKLMPLAALAMLANLQLGVAESTADGHQCVGLAVLTIEPHGQKVEDDSSPIGGWFPLVCRHGAKFAKTGRPADVDINGRKLAGREDFTEMCGVGLELGDKVGNWLSNVRLNDYPPHGQDRMCLALHPIGLYCGARANMAEVMSFRMTKGELPVAVNEEHCPDH